MPKKYPLYFSSCDYLNNCSDFSHDMPNKSICSLKGILSYHDNLSTYSKHRGQHENAQPRTVKHYSWPIDVDALCGGIIPICCWIDSGNKTNSIPVWSTMSGYTIGNLSCRANGGSPIPFASAVVDSVQRYRCYKCLIQNWICFFIGGPFWIGSIS